MSADVKHELLALEQQDEFRTRVFEGSDTFVMSCVSVTKSASGFGALGGMPKQFFLLLTYNRKGEINWQIHAVRLKANGSLVLRTSHKIGQLAKLILDDEIEFRMKFESGQTDHWTLSPGSLRSIELFFFALILAFRHDQHGGDSSKMDTKTSPITLKGKGLDIAALNVEGKRWLTLTFQSPELHSRIASFEQSIVRPIWIQLMSRKEFGADAKTGADCDAQQRGGGAVLGEMALITIPETAVITGYLQECGLTVTDAHLLEARLIESEEQLMRENIEALTIKESELTAILCELADSLETITEVHDSLSELMPSVRSMDRTMAGIKIQNEKLAIQDKNFVKLSEELMALERELELNATTELCMQKPVFSRSKYKDTIKEARRLKEKLDMRLSKPCLESLQAVKERRQYFRQLAERFCAEALDFLRDLFLQLKKDGDSTFAAKHSKSPSHEVATGSQLPSGRVTIGMSIIDDDVFGNNDEIHDALSPYRDLIDIIQRFDEKTFAKVRQLYQSTFAAMYSTYFKSFFHSLNKRIKSEVSASQMATFDVYKLEDFLGTEREVSEISVSLTGSLFKGATNANPARIATVDMMETIMEDDRRKEARTSVTGAFLLGLKQTLPLIVKEQRFVEGFFFADYLLTEDSSQNRMREMEEFVKAMFGSLLPEFVSLCEKGSKLDPLNALQMHVMSDVGLGLFKEDSEFIGELLTLTMGQLSMRWNKFVDGEIKWIKKQRPSIKQAGVLQPMAKFPAFCDRVFAIHKAAEQRSAEIVSLKDELALEFADVCGPILEVRTKPRTFVSEEKRDSRSVDGSVLSVDVSDLRVGRKGKVMFTAASEGALLRSTVHKLGSALFEWLRKTAQTEPKYTDVCLMENMHYFYVIFRRSDKELSSLSEYIVKSQKTFKKYLDKYVKWSVTYECKALTEFWNKLNRQVKSTRGDTDIVAVYLPSATMRTVVKASLNSEKKIHKAVDHMFQRMRKHLAKNLILQECVWRRIHTYFVVKLSKFERNIEMCYQTTLPVPVSKVTEVFKLRFKKGFGRDFDDDRRSELSIGGSSLGATSVASMMITAAKKAARYSRGDSSVASGSTDHSGATHSSHAT